MKVLVVEDDRKVKTQVIDDVLASMGADHDWAENQADARAFIEQSEYDLVLLDLQIPSRPRGQPNAEFGKQLLKQVRTSGTANEQVAVILTTARHHEFVDLMPDLNALGIDSSIAKPFPMSGRTLATVIEQVMEKHKRFGGRQVAAKAESSDSEPLPDELEPFTGGVLRIEQDEITLCGETIATRQDRSLAYALLEALSARNQLSGRPATLKSKALADKLDAPSQNSVSKSIATLRKRITRVMAERVGRRCEAEDVIARSSGGYQLRDWITVDVAEASEPESTTPTASEDASEGFNDRQVWILERINEHGQVRRREIEKAFRISTRTARRDLKGLLDAGRIEAAGTGTECAYVVGCG